jgi:hypothetical protein
MLALADGDTSAALSAVESAEGRTNQEMIIDLNAGEVARLAGRRDLAAQWWGRAFSEDVALPGSSFFRDASRFDLVAPALATADDLLAKQADDIGRALLGEPWSRDIRTNRQFGRATYRT